MSKRFCDSDSPFRFCNCIRLQVGIFDGTSQLLNHLYIENIIIHFHMPLLFIIYLILTKFSSDSKLAINRLATGLFVLIPLSRVEFYFTDDMMLLC